MRSPSDSRNRNWLPTIKSEPAKIASTARRRRRGQASGLIGVDLPEEYGGLGESSATAGVIIGQIAYGDFNASYIQLLAW